MTPRLGGLDANRRDPSPNGHGERATPLFGANQGWSHGNGDSGGKNISDWNTIKWRPRGHRDNDDVAGGRGREKNWKSEKSRPTGFRAGREGGRGRCGQKYEWRNNAARGGRVNACARGHSDFQFSSRMTENHNVSYSPNVTFSALAPINISAVTRLLRPKSDDGDILLTAQLIAGCRGDED